MSKKHNVETSLNRVFTELSQVRKVTESESLNKDEYAKILDIFKVAGRIRQAYLEQLQKNETYA